MGRAVSDTEEIREPKRYAWTIDGELTSGTLQKYAHHWQRNKYSGDVGLSTELISWDGDPGSTPVKLPVGFRRTHVDEDHWIHYEFSVEGDDPVYVSIDGRA